MLNKALIIIGIFFCFNTKAQLGLYTGVGLNRIGVLYDVGIKKIIIERHQVLFTLRFYEPDIVFEKDFPGLNVGYSYDFVLKENRRLQVGLQTGLFYEKKMTNELWIIDPKFVVTGTQQVKNNWEISLNLGIGRTFNHVNNMVTENLTYTNYEMAIGLTYFLHTFTTH